MPPHSSFDQMRGIRWKMPRPNTKYLLLWRFWYSLMGVWRHFRVRPLVTALLGRQYNRARDLIEIDITYLCNLSCLNCNRSVARAPENQSMPIAMIRDFVDESIERKKYWRRIRVLGGEPTLHPEFSEVTTELMRYRNWNPSCIVEVVTNGSGPHVKAALAKLPEPVWLENSHKTTNVHPTFRPFSDAPIDHPELEHADFSNGCAIIRDCGMGLVPGGYYPCAVAGGIDRVLGLELGRERLPDDADDMEELLAKLCQYCGRFQDGHFVPQVLRKPLTEEIISPTWEHAYRKFSERRSGE